VNPEMVMEGVIEGQKLENSTGHSAESRENRTKEFTGNSAVGYPWVVRIIVAEATSPKMESEHKR